MTAILASLALAGVLGAPAASQPAPGDAQTDAIEPAPREEQQPISGPVNPASSDARPAASEAPGGYWSLSERHARTGEPEDGEEQLTVGSILFSLGLLRAGAAGITVWMAGQPGLCPASDEAGCDSFRIYGLLGFGEGGLMVGTGIVYLAMGLARRAKHQRWVRGETVALSPWLMPDRAARVGRGGRLGARLGGAGLQFRMRF